MNEQFKFYMMWFFQFFWMSCYKLDILRTFFFTDFFDLLSVPQDFQFLSLFLGPVYLFSPAHTSPSHFPLPLQLLGSKVLCFSQKFLLIPAAFKFRVFCLHLSFFYFLVVIQGDTQMKGSLFSVWHRLQSINCKENTARARTCLVCT